MSDDRPILLLGRSGQVGSALAPLLERVGPTVTPSRAEADLGRPDATRSYVLACAPRLIVNAAAYTAVDAAEDARDECFRINADAPAAIADAAKSLGAAVVHYSTDYVYDGCSPRPYVESDAPAPLNVYGASKLAGDRALMGAGIGCLILRTSWVYAAQGKNFVRKILELARRAGPLRVVDDQRGSPTSNVAIAEHTAEALRQLAGDPNGIESALRREGGVYHLTASGDTTWFAFAQAILRGDPRKHEHRLTELSPTTTDASGAKAPRPRFSVLDNGRWERRFSTRMPHWQDQLDRVLSDLR